VIILSPMFLWRPGVFNMREEYDFSNLGPNPYIKNLKKQITIRLEEDVISYFKTLADETGIPYQTLINLYLQDCAKFHRIPSLEWA
jgi:predicted DNA binding CopG/RHH family protein